VRLTDELTSAHGDAGRPNRVHPLNRAASRDSCVVLKGTDSLDYIYSAASNRRAYSAHGDARRRSIAWHLVARV